MVTPTQQPLFPPTPARRRQMPSAALADLSVYAQVTRERVDALAARLTAMENKLNYLLAGVFFQLMAFVSAVLVAVVTHAR